MSVIDTNSRLIFPTPKVRADLEREPAVREWEGRHRACEEAMAEETKKISAERRRAAMAREFPKFVPAVQPVVQSEPEPDPVVEPYPAPEAAVEPTTVVPRSALDRIVRNLPKAKWFRR